MRNRQPSPGFGALFLLVMGAGPSAFAQFHPPDTNATSFLAPPYGEMAPTFWESHGIVIIVGAIVIILAITATLSLALQPRRRVPPTLATVAHKELAQLSNRPEDDACLSAVSRVLRSYFIGVFRLGHGELNTAEFC